MVSSAIKGQLILLYFLKKTEENVRTDVFRGIKNINTWLDMMFQ